MHERHRTTGKGSPIFQSVRKIFLKLPVILWAIVHLPVILWAIVHLFEHNWRDSHK